MDEAVAATYDESLAAMLDDAVVQPAVAHLAVLAGDGPAPELGIGTPPGARPPLSRRGVAVHGIDLSTAMVPQLTAKSGGDGAWPTACASVSAFSPCSILAPRHRQPVQGHPQTSNFP